MSWRQNISDVVLSLYATMSVPLPCLISTVWKVPTPQKCIFVHSIFRIRGCKKKGNLGDTFLQGMSSPLSGKMGKGDKTSTNSLWLVRPNFISACHLLNLKYYIWSIFANSLKYRSNLGLKYSRWQALLGINDDHREGYKSVMSFDLIQTY